VLRLIEETKPDLVFVAGDLSDPHGRIAPARPRRGCARSDIRNAAGGVAVWGAWQEWSLTEADVLVPLSQDELNAKILAIFRHQSQKDTAPFRVTTSGSSGSGWKPGIWRRPPGPTGLVARVLRYGSLCNSKRLAAKRCTAHCPFIMLAPHSLSPEEAQHERSTTKALSLAIVAAVWAAISHLLKVICNCGPSSSASAVSWGPAAA